MGYIPTMSKRELKKVDSCLKRFAQQSKNTLKCDCTGDYKLMSDIVVHKKIN